MTQGNKLTTEEKAKVFAMYWDQKVYGDLQDDNEQANFGVVDLDFDNFQYCVDENMKLVLTPLEKISFEDAIEVCRMVICPNNHYPVSDYRINRDAETSIMVTINNDWYEDSIRIGKNTMVVWMPETKNARIGADVYDYLRSKGYAEKSIFEKGIAIDKTLK